MGAWIALGSVVRKPKSSCSPSIRELLGPLTPRQGVHRPAKAKIGLSSLSANQIGVLRGFVSEYRNEVAALRHSVSKSGPVIAKAPYPSVPTIFARQAGT